MQDPVLVGRDGRDALGHHRIGDASPKWPQRVFAKVVSVAEVDAFEKKSNLDVLEPGFRRLDPNGRAFSRDQRATHDLSMVSSSSVFTGFAM